jgi:hypothetical protein
MGEMRNAQQIWVALPLGKRPHKRPNYREHINTQTTKVFPYD